MIGPWQFRFFLIFLFLIVGKTLPDFGWLMLGVAALVIIIKLLHEIKFLPRFAMDILDRLTNKEELERRVEEKERETVLIDSEELASYLKSKIVGQDAVCDSVSLQIRRRMAARRPDKPVAVFTFAGPPGVGKSLFAKVLAEKLYGDSKQLLFFDMSQFAQPHAAASLFGQAKGYVGSTTYGSLTGALRDYPSSVVLLDEFEKAHPEVHKRFLTAWNDGFLTEVSDGTRVSTSEAIFILTTNAASKKLGALAARYGSNQSDLARSMKIVLEEERFAPEVLSRIDDFFAFKPLEGLDIARVVALEIEKIVQQFQLQLADGGIDPRILLDALEKKNAHSNEGVRELARAVERQITDAIIDAKTAGAKEIRLRNEHGAIVVDTLSSHENAEKDASLPPPVGTGRLVTGGSA